MSPPGGLPPFFAQVWGFRRKKRDQSSAAIGKMVRDAGFEPVLPPLSVNELGAQTHK